MMKKLLFKTLILGIMILGGASCAWADATQLNANASATSWDVPSSSSAKAGDYIQLDGIRMTFGSISDETTTWSKNGSALQPTSMPYYYVGETKTPIPADFSTSSTLPTGGCFFVFEPTKTGILTIKEKDSQDAAQNVFFATVTSDGSTIKSVNLQQISTDNPCTRSFYVHKDRKYYFFQSVKIDNSTPKYDSYRNLFYGISFADAIDNNDNDTYTFPTSNSTVLPSGLSITCANLTITLGGSVDNVWTGSDNGAQATYTPNTLVASDASFGTSTLVTEFTKSSTLPVEGGYLVINNISENGTLTFNAKTSGGSKPIYYIDATENTLTELDILSRSTNGTNQSYTLGVQKGHTYYLFQAANSTVNSYRCSFKSITFAASTANTYAFSSTWDFPYVDGIVMQYGKQATTANVWKFSNATTVKLFDGTDNGTYSADAPASGNLPTDGFYIVFKPYKNGLLELTTTLNFYGTTKFVKLGDEEKPLFSEAKGVNGTGSTTTGKMWVESGNTYYFTSNDRWTRFTGFSFEDEISATIGSTGWTTFASSYPLDLTTLTASEGTATAYYASAANSSTVTMTSTTSTVPAGEGLMIKGTAGATVTIPVATSGTAISGNLLKGCTSSTPLTTNSNYYVLVNNEGTPEFQCLDNNGATIPAGKAYLDLTGLSMARSLSIVFDDNETTSISEELRVNSEEFATAPVYDLQGRRVDGSRLMVHGSGLKPGLYIKNGKKVIVK